uniref:DNA repair protein XRCC1-like n=2 Tax=Ciona intestinalis TaxID=7719 RepID=H2Y3N6_CIOIN
MPQIKLEHVVSFSSEHKEHKVENLLKSGKWKCAKPGEKQSFVVFQFKKATKISSIDIGNDGSAFVEVLVCRSGGEEKYEVLLLASSLMSPLESRTGEGANRVRMFSREKLVSSAAEQIWDQVKVVCTQPFNKNTMYGLSFIRFNTDEEKPEVLKQETQEKNVKVEITPQKKKVAPTSTSKAKIQETVIKKEPPNDTSSISKKLAGLKRSAEQRRNEGTPKKKQTLDPGSDLKMDKLLKDVVIALSGYQNPERGNIRDTAMKMGAQYRKDWTADCTHLICAFPNTPKYTKVIKCGGKVVKHTWIMDCWSNKKLMNWKSYSLAPVASDDEDKEQSNSPKQKANNVYDESTDAEDSEDTDAEIDGFLKSDKKEKGSATNGGNVENVKSLPNYFDSLGFCLVGEFSAAVERMLRRHVTVFGGNVHDSIEDNDVTHVVTQGGWNTELKKRLKSNPSLQFVRPEWVFKCSKSASLLPCAAYAVPRS